MRNGEWFDMCGLIVSLSQRLSILSLVYMLYSGTALKGNLWNKDISGHLTESQLYITAYYVFSPWNKDISMATVPIPCCTSSHSSSWIVWPTLPFVQSSLPIPPSALTSISYPSLCTAILFLSLSLCSHPLPIPLSVQPSSPYPSLCAAILFLSLPLYSHPHPIPLSVQPSSPYPSLCTAILSLSLCSHPHPIPPSVQPYYPSLCAAILSLSLSLCSHLTPIPPSVCLSSQVLALLSALLLLWLPWSH